MPDSPSTGDPKPSSARPSFTGYWKRSKDQQATQSLTFVSSKLGQSLGTSLIIPVVSLVPTCSWGRE
jgi:hypothetical protein